MNNAAHLCLTCKLAEWNKTAAGRLHPNGEGMCRWKPAHIPTPRAWKWAWGDDLPQPKPFWGQIDRKPEKSITECETYETLK
jgi:hypothetical protein